MTKTKCVISVFNRTASKADMLVEAGATFKPAHEVAKDADYLFLMLGYPEDVEKMVLSEEGVLQHMKKGAYLIDHTTSSPGLAYKIWETAKENGVHSIDAPVSGGDIGAKNGQVVTMVGAENEAFDKVKPLMETYSKRIELMGGPSMGQHTKAVSVFLKIF
jgi:3-hydroxyisobutyrate dehydrogenase